MNPDLVVQNEGSIYLLIPRSPKGDEWIENHVDSEAMKFANAIVVEHRYIEDIVEGARGDGLVVA